MLVATDERRTLTKRRVEIGSIVQGYAAVDGGLREDEWVVASTRSRSTPPAARGSDAMIARVDRRVRAPPGRGDRGGAGRRVRCGYAGARFARATPSPISPTRSSRSSPNGWATAPEVAEG